MKGIAATIPFIYYLTCRRLNLQRLNVRCLPALGTLYNVELDCLAFLKALKTAGIDRRVVYKHVLAVLAADKAKALRVIEPLHCSLFHFVSFLVSNFIIFRQIQIGSAQTSLAENQSVSNDV